MPVLVGTITTPTPTPPGGPTTPARPADPGRPYLLWIAPDGTEVHLTSDSELHFALDGWSNVTGVAPVSIVADPHPRGGTRVRHIQAQPRVMAIPVRVRADTHMELVQGWRFIGSKFAQTRRLGPGTLRLLRPDGTGRDILAYYQAGMDGEPGQGHTWDTAVLSLYCEDPFWRSSQAVALPYAYLGSAVSYLNPYLTVTPSNILGATSAVNDGDVEAWPVWEITGPATGLTATNNTTGESFTLTATLTGGQVARITTDPPTVRGPADAIWTDKLSWPGAVLWGLQPGRNDVTFSVAGATSETRLVLSYVPRYETA